MDPSKITETLYALYEASPEEVLQKEDRLVIFSDLHMGDGNGNDDFIQNAGLFQEALKNYYLPQGFGLMLNGDVEELQRFPLDKITHNWKSVYHLFDAYANAGKLWKTVGNHDLDLFNHTSHATDYNLLPSLRLNYDGHNIFLFHGHQASKKYGVHNRLVGYSLKYLANPLGIKNYSVAHSSKKQYNIEKRVYKFSSTYKVMSVIGHTHRPLFESMSKDERIRFRIEQLCRDIAQQRKPESISQMKQSIKKLRDDLKEIYEGRLKKGELRRSLYNSLLHVPCLFNSGCVIGKRGMTGIEISDGQIRLVHWFDKNISRKYLQHNGYDPEPLKGTDFFRMVINQEPLEYIFNRIELLA